VGSGELLTSDFGLLKSDSNLFRRISNVVLFALLSSFLIFPFSKDFLTPAHAVPAAPDISNIVKTNLTGGNMDLEVSFLSPGDASIVGYRYSTDTGTTYKDCVPSGSNCTFATLATRLSQLKSCRIRMIRFANLILIIST